MNSMDYSNDPRAVLIHFNPNHDRLGRFAKSLFGGSRASKPIDKNSDKGYNKKEQTDKSSLNAGKFVKIGATVAISALAAYGGYTLYKSGALDNYIDSGRSMLNNVLGKHKTRTASNFGPEVTPTFSGIGDWNISDFTKSLQGSFPHNQKPSSQNVKPVTEAAKGLKKLAKSESISQTLKNTNPHFGEAAYNGNCTLSSIAGYLRGQGYDVRAGKVPGGAQYAKDVVQRIFKIDLSIDESRMIDDLATHFAKSPDAASRILVRKFGNNAEGIIGFAKKKRGNPINQPINDGNPLADGHEFNFKIINGIVTFFDTQDSSGTRDDSWCRSVIWSQMAADKPYHAIRLDGLELNIDAVIRELE